MGFHAAPEQCAPRSKPHRYPGDASAEKHRGITFSKKHYVSCLNVLARRAECIPTCSQYSSLPIPSHLSYNAASLYAGPTLSEEQRHGALTISTVPHWSQGS